MEIKLEAPAAVATASTPPHHLDLFFYSTPSSPRLSSFDNYHDDHISLLSHGHESESFSSVPVITSNSADSEFEFSGQLYGMVPPSLSSADQLFDGGVIRPLKPPPGLVNVHADSPRSPKSPIVSKFKSALSMSPRQMDDPFEAALRISANHAPVRGRDPVLRGNSHSRKALSRSLSPLRVSEFALLQQQQEEEQNSKDSKSSKKWRLKDLFRSASEGRPGGKKYSFLSRRNSMDNDKDGSSKGGSSFRSTISGGSVSNRRGQSNISAQETHYTGRRSVPELKKKTSLPYRHNLLGCLGFSPILQDLSTAFAS
ncbi:uncharacterized protein LOC141590442 [Silene latifolia]|uniref:uncharacterized protein LOC141590442 n=1 Tax=Silene latifolia TaxID=37657 RepID=UPI003D7729F1